MKEKTIKILFICINIVLLLSTVALSYASVFVSYYGSEKEYLFVKDLAVTTGIVEGLLFFFTTLVAAVIYD